jgi:hypothetical protein
MLAAPNEWERNEWATVLTGEMVETWRGAFERRPASGPERALRAVADDPERVPVPERTERACEHCSGPIPDDRDPRTRYCCDRCRKTAHYARSHPVAA